ncbi:MAG: arginase family protein [Anaerolineales bacterium]|nr:MAG: arginase family protein [Anaerolineales bacterium]
MPGNYLLRPKRSPQHRYAYIGVPHDAATSLGNPGARFAPQALREALRGVFDWRLQDGQLADIDRGVIDLSGVEVADWGDIALSYHDTEQCVAETYQTVRDALKAGHFPLVVGGDHGITFPCVKALHDTCQGPIGLIQLDAHCDLLDYSDRQGRYSGSSGVRRSLELERLTGSNVVQIGLRGYATVEQYQMGQHLGVHRISAARLADMGAQAAAEQALSCLQVGHKHASGNGVQAIYLTIDLDALNPGEAPGTGWPEPGGLTSQQLLELVRLLAPHVAAVDIAELNPVYDSRARTTTILAARLLLDCITARL